ncbi:hypothetical protein LCGC14_0823630 [marine sediment metagenome]|uniref:Uncharacterized protein n=1 Tax=marine sediment metagenome TaxID=412755 RepID=A0A0F9PI35_9ZZZZ
MPTKKPYRVSVRLKQHDKPTRRVPPDGTIVGRAALVVVTTTDGMSILGDIDVLASEQDGEDVRDTANGLAMWLALGAHLAERSTNAFEQFFFQSVLGVAGAILEDPEGTLQLRQLVDTVQDIFGKVGEAALVEQAKKTSTEGTN